MFFSSSSKALEPRVLAENEGYSLLQVPVTLGTERRIRVYLYGLKSEEVNRLLAQAKQEYTLLDFKGERPMVIFESPLQITESVIEQAKEHFTSRFLSEKRMSGMTL